MKSLKNVFLFLSMFLLLANVGYAGRYYDCRVARWLTPDPKMQNVPDVSPYNYCHNNPISRIDPDGNSDLHFIKHSQIIVLTDKNGKEVGRWDASNKGISTSKGVFKNGGGLDAGVYDFQDKSKPTMHGDQVDKKGIKKDSKNGMFGENGIFKLEPFTDSQGVAHADVGVHSGRDNAGGWDANTDGCVRTTDDAMETTVNTAKDDPLNTLDVIEFIDSPVQNPNNQTPTPQQLDNSTTDENQNQTA